MQQRRENSQLPCQVKDILIVLLPRLGVDNKIKQLNVLKCWPEVVGETVSRHSAPFAIKKGNLFVKVDSSAWLSQLHHFKEKIISKFNKREGMEVIREIHFTLGNISFSRRRHSNRLRRVRLEKKDLEWVKKTANKIQDKDLRRLIERILKKHKRLEKIKRMEEESGKNGN